MADGLLRALTEPLVDGRHNGHAVAADEKLGALLEPSEETVA
jgi:hypothetical protein